MAAIGGAMLAGALPPDKPAYATALVEVVRGVDIAAAGLAPAPQGELQQLFGLLSFPVTRGFAAGIWSSWDDASPADVAKFLERWRFSGRNAVSYGISGAAHDRDGVVVRQRRVVGEDRVSRSAEPRLMIPDPIVEGIKHGWDVRDLSKLQGDLHLEADVVIVGTGAGGGTAAEILSNAGLKVVMVEAGALLSSSDFHMLEREAYPLMYQESGNRQTSRTRASRSCRAARSADRRPSTGRAVFARRPGRSHTGASDFGLNDYTPEALAPWFCDDGTSGSTLRRGRCRRTKITRS